MTTEIEYVRCTCGGNHGIVQVYTAPDEHGREKRWCIKAFRAQFSPCPGCKGIRKNGICPKNCQSCSTHGPHEGRRCPTCAAAPGMGKAFDTFVVKPAIWAFLGLVTLGALVLVVAAYLLTLPFVMLLAEWFSDNGFERLSWAVIIGPAPILIVIAMVVVLKGAISEFQK